MKTTAGELIRRLNIMAGNVDEAPPGKPDIFGVEGMKVLKIPHKDLVELINETGAPNQALSTELWSYDLYEAKILACLFADPQALTEELVEKLARDNSSWILCEYCCNKVVWKTPFAMKKAVEWSESSDDMLTFAGFCLTGALAKYLPTGSSSELGFFDRALFTARKQASRQEGHSSRAISSALKLIGMRGKDWHEAAVETCEEIAAQPSESAKWVATQALAELMTSELRKAFGE